MGTFKIGKVVMKSLFKKPATLMYPVIPREWQERTRGSIDIDKDNCILCGICGRKCPTDAITVDRKGGTWEIMRMQCIQCGCCVEVCPKKCLEMNPQYTEPDVEKIIDTVEVPVQEKKPAGDGEKKPKLTPEQIEELKAKKAKEKAEKLAAEQGEAPKAEATEEASSEQPN